MEERIYIYIYIYKERETETDRQRERQRSKEPDSIQCLFLIEEIRIKSILISCKNFRSDYTFTVFFLIFKRLHR